VLLLAAIVRQVGAGAVAAPASFQFTQEIAADKKKASQMV
jgi:hypothetical protein